MIVTEMLIVCYLIIIIIFNLLLLPYSLFSSLSTIFLFFYHILFVSSTLSLNFDISPSISYPVTCSISPFFSCHVLSFPLLSRALPSSPVMCSPFLSCQVLTYLFLSRALLSSPVTCSPFLFSPVTCSPLLSCHVLTYLFLLRALLSSPLLLRALLLCA